MERITDYVYKVEQGEEVTLIFTPVQVGSEYIAMALDGQPLQFQSDLSPTCSFTSTKPSGQTHFGIIECSFPGDTPDSAKFEIQVRGSKGGNFSGPTVNKTDAVHDPNIEFRVV